MTEVLCGSSSQFDLHECENEKKKTKTLKQDFYDVIIMKAGIVVRRVTFRQVYRRAVCPLVCMLIRWSPVKYEVCSWHSSFACRDAHKTP